MPSRRLRAGRRTNVALLVAVVTAAVTGGLAFAVGTPGAQAFVTVAHGAAGLALLVLAPWKSVVVGRARRRRGGWRVTAGAVLGLLLLVSVVAGVVHALAGWQPVAGVTALQVHVGAALAALPFLARHVVAHPQWPRRTDASRRVLLRGAAAGAGSLATWAAVEGVAAAGRLPGAAARATGSTERGSGTPERMPVTQWAFDQVPRVDRAAWRLAVATPAGTGTWSAGDLAAYDDSVTAVLDCTGGWWARQEWSGLWLSRLLPDDVPGRSVDVVSVTGYRRRFPRRDAGRVLLATAVAGQPLTPGHGAPLRAVAPGRRGFWWVKWVDRVELTDEPWWWQPPFPLR